MTRAVLVTGASKGIGAACVQRLAAAGWHVYAGVRSERDAEALRAGDDAVTPIMLDVTRAADIEAAASLIHEAVGGRGLDAVVNNAGMAVGGPLEFLPIDELRRQLEVNVTGQIAVTQAFLPLLRRARRAVGGTSGRIVFMSSVSGRSALPFIGAYGASKFALEAAADALRIELRPFGLRVVLVEPGVIATPIWDTAVDRLRGTVHALPEEARAYYGGPLASLERWTSSRMGGLPPERVARVVERALTTPRPRARYVIGRDARARILLEALLPARLRDWLIDQGVRRIQPRRRHDP